ncbi:cytochrome P450 [Mycena latifolia]|nr:cytochrome P450 [Mycena latifolia]
MSYGTIAAGSIAILLLYTVFPRRSTIQNLVGPPSPSWIFGNMLQLMVPPQYGDHEFRWQKLYGAVYRVKGCFGQDRLMVSDLAALQYILNSPLFEHAPMLDNKVHLIFGEHSVSAAKGDTHKRLRAAMNPSFTAAAVRNYQPLIESVAQTITEELEETSDTESMDICPLLNAAALDAVSKANLGYSIQDLGEEFVANNSQVMALASIQSAGHILADAIGAFLPAWILAMAVHFPTTGFKIIRRAKYLSNRLGHKIVQEKVDAGRQGLELNDVFGLLLNTEKSGNTKITLSREELAAQTAIILVAGQDTTANTLTLGLLELARNPEFQDRLRAEVHSARAGNRHLAYDTLPLLNAFIKEVLRKYPAAPLLDRIAVQDTIIPLTESVVTSSGDSVNHIPIRKGQIVTVASASYHRLESRWGADAHEFKPSRWLEGAACRGEAIGPYANLLTFLGGPRTCLGWRFGLLVMQAIICELVDKFSFALPEGSAVRVRVANTLIPIDATGKKAAHLRLTRI